MSDVYLKDKVSVVFSDMIAVSCSCRHVWFGTAKYFLKYLSYLQGWLINGVGCNVNL